jgi:hypothetical protein
MAVRRTPILGGSNVDAVAPAYRFAHVALNLDS